MSPRDFRFIFVACLLFVSSSVSGAGPYRIIAGRKTTTLEFPYIAAIEVRNSHFCGGSIIAPKYILTAAHCLKWAEHNYSMYKVVMTIRVAHDRTTTGGTRYFIDNIYPHEKYDEQSRTLHHDIGLVKLTKPMKYTDRVQPIEMVTKAPADGTMSWVTGYGKQERRSLSSSKRFLMTVQMPVISYPNCVKILGAISNDMICAGTKSGHEDACSGDSGGPLAVDGKLAGIVSWGIGCGRVGLPGVYTDVSQYRQWVLDKMAALGN